MQVKDTTPFVRIPVSSLGLTKGQMAVAVFEQARVVITGAVEPATPTPAG